MTRSTRLPLPPASPACRSSSSEGTGAAWPGLARAHQAWRFLRRLPAAPQALLRTCTLLATLAFASCATTYRLDSQVNSFSSLAGMPTAGYRFERMPLQQADPNQPRVEALAQAALARAGLRRDDAWAVVQQVADPWGGPAYGPWGRPYGSWGHLGVAGGSGGPVGVGVGIGFPLGGPGPYYGRTWLRREVGLVMRDLATGQVVYQTQAVNDGPWLDADRAIGASFDAALQGFPRPPAGPRQVDVTMPR